MALDEAALAAREAVNRFTQPAQKLAAGSHPLGVHLGLSVDRLHRLLGDRHRDAPLQKIVLRPFRRPIAGRRREPIGVDAIARQMRPLAEAFRQTIADTAVGPPAKWGPE